MKTVVRARLGKPGVGIREGEMIQTAVRLPPDVMDHAVEVATRRGISTSSLLRNWLTWASTQARANRTAG